VWPPPSFTKGTHPDGIDEEEDMAQHCKRCDSVKLTSVSGKTSDLCSTRDLDTGTETDGYTNENPRLKRIEEWGDYLTFTFCADCGQIQEMFKRGK